MAYMKAFVHVRYTGETTRLAGHGLITTGQELYLTWKEWDYLVNSNALDDAGNPPEFEKLGEADRIPTEAPTDDVGDGKDTEGKEEGKEEQEEEEEENDEEESSEEDDDDGDDEDEPAGGAGGAAMDSDNGKDDEKDKTETEAETVDSYEELTVAQLREQLTLRGIEYGPRAIKADLVALLEKDDG